MNARTIQADKISNEGHALGVLLWDTLQAVPLTDRRDVFETALQLIAQSVAGREQSNLIEASAMLAVIDQFPAREFRIRGEAEDAHCEYVNFLRAEYAADEADYRADCARDERLMGDA